MSYSALGKCSIGHSDADGYRYILLCRVIVGDSVLGSKKASKMQLKMDGSEYDTRVDSIKKPSIFVVWRDYTAIPAFLVKFK